MSLVAGVVLAATAVTAAPASAAVPGLVTVTAATGLDSNVYKSVRVFCPSGLKVVGGGYSLNGADGSVVLDDFIPSADSVLVGAGEVVGPGEPSDGTTESWQVQAIAVCANPLPGYTIVSTPSDFRTGDRERGVQTTCPAGTTAIGGGASLANGFGQISITNLQIVNNGTFASAIPDEDGYSGKWSVTAYAICSAGGLPGLETIYAFSDQDSSGSRTQIAHCPVGKQVIGGGFAVGDSQVLNLELSFRGAGLPGALAYASEDANGYTGNWGMFAQAVCANA